MPKTSEAPNLNHVEWEKVEKYLKRVTLEDGDAPEKKDKNTLQNPKKKEETFLCTSTQTTDPTKLMIVNLIVGSESTVAVDGDGGARSYSCSLELCQCGDILEMSVASWVWDECDYSVGFFFYFFRNSQNKLMYKPPKFWDPLKFLETRLIFLLPPIYLTTFF